MMPRMVRMFSVLVFAGLALLGCQSGVGSFQTVRLPTDDYDRTFDVARQVLSESFVIEQADKAAGRIVTSPKAAAEPEGIIGAVLDLPGTVRQARRIASAQVSRTGRTTKVSIKVQLQVAEAIQTSPRPTYSEYDPTGTGAESDFHREPERRVGVTWKMAGSDVEMENKLLAEIERRLKRDTPKPESPKMLPEETE